MQRAEAEEQILKTISNMNPFGLERVCRLIDRMDTIEAYNINITPERIAEIRKQREQEETEWKAQEEEWQVKKLECSRERMKSRIDRRNAAIASLTGRERKFWEKVEKVQNMDIERYDMYTWQIMLIANLFDNNYTEASHIQFLYGFYQGIQYTKAKAKKHKV